MYDVTPLIGRGVFQTIEPLDAFGQVSVVEGGGGIEWVTGPDLSRESIYFDGALAQHIPMRLAVLLLLAIV